MKDYTLNLIINFLLMVFAVYSVKELIFDNNLTDRFYRKIKKEGWFLIILAILSITFNFIRDKRSDKNQEKIDFEKAKVDSILQSTQEELKDLQLKTKDTIIATVEKTYQNSIEATNKALAEYNLVITDSLIKVINQLEINAVNPQLRLAPLSPDKPFAYLTNKNGEDIFYIIFNSVEGTSYNINLTCYFIDQHDSERIYNSGILTKGNQFLTQDVNRSYSLLVKDNHLRTFEELLVFITGNFSKDPEGKIIIPYNTAFTYNFKENKLITKKQDDFDNLKKRLKIK